MQYTHLLIIKRLAAFQVSKIVIFYHMRKVEKWKQNEW